MKRKRLTALLLSALAASACTKDSQTESSTAASQAPEKEVTEDITEEAQNETSEATPEPGEAVSSEEFVNASNRLGIDIYKAQATEAGNIALSPTSIALAFGMTYAGASDETKTEMAKVLHFPEGDEIHNSAQAVLANWSAQKGPYTFRVANRLFPEKTYSIEEDFLATTKERYFAPTESLDFKGDPEAQRKHINQWVEEQTEERIVDLLPSGSIDGSTRMVLANAVYFLGTWEHPFSVDTTAKRPFWIQGKKKTKVDMMSQTADFGYASADKVKLLQMPYKGSKLAMTIALPNERDGLAAVEKALSGEVLEDWMSKLKGSADRVQVSFPKFELKDATLPLKERLMELGMTRAFDQGKAEFFAMARPANKADELYISDAFHKAFVKVDEKGTEAAAATAVVMATRAMAGQPESFVADRPFLFLIHDLESEAVLFIGRVSDPS